MGKFLRFGTGLLLGVAVTAVAALAIGQAEGTDLQLLIAAVSGIATLATGVIVALITQSKARERELEIQSQIRQREAEEAHRATKVEIFSNFLGVVGQAMASANLQFQGEPPNQQELMQSMVDFRNGLILYASPELVKAYLDWVRVQGASSDVVFPAIDAVYTAMRDDIGLNNVGLDHLELIRMYLSDPDEMDSILGNGA